MSGHVTPDSPAHLARACPACGGALAPQGELQDRAWRCDGCGRLHLPGSVPVTTEEWRRLTAVRPAWWGHATCEEVLAFGLGAASPPDGSGIPGLDDRELRRLLALAAGRLRDPHTRSGWLRDFAAWLLAERRARERTA